MIPELTYKQLIEYRDHRVPPGGFVRACLENDLTQALNKADHSNTRAIFDIARFMHWELPSPAWGNPSKVRDWLEKRNAEAPVGEPAADR